MKTNKLSFLNEKDGQIRFFQDLRISADVSLTNNTDGVYKGTLFEFKLTISDINKVLFQSIKYLSHMRIKGESIPKTILLVALNEGITYKFESKDFLKYIETIYFGASSKDNKDFSTDIRPEKIIYSNIAGLSRLTEILQDEGFIKIHIDIYDVVGWTNRFYSENPKATKTALFNELKKPNFDLSYFSSDKTVSYYLNKPSKGVDSNSYLCYNTIKETINSGAVIKEFCYSGYYEK